MVFFLVISIDRYYQISYGYDWGDNLYFLVMIPLGFDWGDFTYFLVMIPPLVMIEEIIYTSLLWFCCWLWLGRLHILPGYDSTICYDWGDIYSSFLWFHHWLWLRRHLFFLVMIPPLVMNGETFILPCYDSTIGYDCRDIYTSWIWFYHWFWLRRQFILAGYDCRDIYTFWLWFFLLIMYGCFIRKWRLILTTMMPGLITWDC